MDQKDFDNILRTKLGQLKESSQMSPDWDRMQKEILEDNLNDQSFDAQIKSKLSEIKAANYNPKNWSLLFALIDKRIKNKQAVLSYKLIELSLILLLAFTSFNLGFLENSENNKEDKVNNPVEFAAVIQDNAEQTRLDLLDASSELEDRIHETDVNTINKSTQLVSQISKLATMTNVNSFSIATITTKPLPSIGFLSFASNKLNEQPIKRSDEKADKSSFGVASTNKRSTLRDSRKNFSSTLLPETELVAFALNETSIVHDELVSSSRPKWFFDVQSGYQFNKVQSHVYESIVENRSGFNLNPGATVKESMNAAFAVEVGKNIGAFDISVGAGYQDVRYNPALNLTTGNITSRYTETSVESIEYQMLSIPVNLRWKAFKWGNWTTSLQGSLISTLLLRSEQKVNQKLIQGDRIQNVAQNNIDYTTLDYEFTQGLSDEPAAIPNGILNNYFLRSSFGGEISKKIAPGTSIFGAYNYIFNLPVKSAKFRNSDQIRSQYFGIGLRKYIG